MVARQLLAVLLGMTVRQEVIPKYIFQVTTLIMTILLARLSSSPMVVLRDWVGVLMSLAYL